MNGNDATIFMYVKRNTNILFYSHVYIPFIRNNFIIYDVNSFFILIINVNTETFDVSLIELTEDK